MTHYRFDDDGNELPPVACSISEINENIKSLIEEEAMLQDVYAIGEVSNFKKHSSGHIYLSLKDENSEIRAVIFRTYAQRIRFKIENGMKVIVHARVGVYVQSGSYQLYIDTIQPDGIGSFQLAFEQLKDKLEKEGLFDVDHKKELPQYPKVIGVVTSPTGAAIKDIIKVVSTRYPFAKVLLFPSLVQGELASRELTAGVEYFNITNSADVIIIGRGGGSIEDLWAFNDETLARAIYHSKIPVISAVGHEIDFTICDFVSDARAATPSHAAELATPSLTEISNKLNELSLRMAQSVLDKIEYYKYKLAELSSTKVLKNPISMLDVPKLDLIYLEEKLDSSFAGLLSAHKIAFSEVSSKLTALNPMAVLARGYGAIYDENNNIIKSKTSVKEGDSITIKFSDGDIHAIVHDKKE